MNFNDLPIEIQLRVFSYFTQQELISVAAPICRNWYRMAHDPLFWKSLYFCGRKHSHELVRRFLEFSVNVTRLTFGDFYGKFNWVSNLPKRETVRALEVEFCDQFDSKSVSELVDKFPLVETLILSCLHNYDQNLGHQINCWKMLKKVFFNLNEYTEIELEEFISFVAKNFHQLDDISLFCFVLPERSLLKLGNIKGQQLSKFGLTNCGISDLQFKMFCEFFYNLTELAFVHCDVIGNDFTASKHLKNLQKLRIVQCEGENFHTFFHETIFLNLNELIFFSHHLKDDVMELLRKSCPSLKKLHLRSCAIETRLNIVTEEGLNSAISGLTNLNHVIIENFALVTGKCFLYFPQNLNNLEINFCTNVTKATLDEISSQRSNVKLTFDSLLWPRGYNMSCAKMPVDSY